LTEVPEHLLARSRARRAALSGEAVDAPAPAAEASSAPVPTSQETAPAATTAAAAPAAVTPAAVEPTPPWVEAASRRRKIPFWAVPVLALLPFWAVLYALTLDPPTPKDSPIALGDEVYANKGCSGCHGAGGGGNGNIPALIGDTAVTKVWPTPAKQVAWIALGSEGWKKAGETTMENGLAVKGGMPSFKAALDPEEIMAVTLHERLLNGEAFDAELWSKDFAATVEEYLPEQAAEYEKVLEEWTAQPPV
jgi:mono/diheme cytochrome c family protein